MLCGSTLRNGIRVQDTRDELILHEKVTVALEVNKRTRGMWQDRSPDLHRLVDAHLVPGAKLQPRITDTTRLVWDLLDQDKLVLLEGGQARCSRQLLQVRAAWPMRDSPR